MNRDENLAMWRRIAAGELSGTEQWDSIDPWEWIRGIAQGVVAADAVKGKNERPAAIIKAVGLSGQVDGYAALRELIDTHKMFSPIDDDGNEIPQTQGQKIAGVVAGARTRGLFDPDGSYFVDDKKAKDLIRELWHQRI